jgi:hypothetical protein
METLYKCILCDETENLHFNYDWSKAERPVLEYICNNCGLVTKPFETIDQIIESKKKDKVEKESPFSFICNIPDCPHCEEDRRQMMDDEDDWDDIFETIEKDLHNELPNRVKNYLRNVYKVPEKTNVPYVSDDFQIGPDGAYEQIEFEGDEKYPFKKFTLMDETPSAPASDRTEPIPRLMYKDGKEIRSYHSPKIDEMLKEIEEDNVYEMAQTYAIESGSLNRESRRKGFVDGYNKAKEILYTEEQVMEAISMAMDPDYIPSVEIIQSLKQPKK